MVWFRCRSTDEEVDWEGEERLSDGDASWANLAASYSKHISRSLKKKTRTLTREHAGDDDDDDTETETACESDDSWETESETEKESEGEGGYTRQINQWFSAWLQ